MKRVKAAIFCIAASLLGMSGQLAAQSNPPKVRPAPDFTLTDSQGKQVSLAEFRGRVVVLQFFQTTCPVCQKHAPMLEKLYRTYKDRGVAVMGVSHNVNSPEALQAFAKTYDITYSLLVGDLEIAVRYLGLSPQNPKFDVPHYFVIDREGRIVQEIDPTHASPEFTRNPEGTLRQTIDEALAGAPAAHSPGTASH